MTTKYTPGDWQVASEATATVLAPSKTGLRIIAVCEQPNQTEHARLIAAAPELLAMAQNALEALEGLKESNACMSDFEKACIPSLRAIIAKATGEIEGGAL
jgi:hypothetical protein